MNTQRIRHAGVWLAAAMFVFACALPFSAPTPEVLSREQLNTLVAGTSAAAQTQTAVLSPPSLTPTLTRTPSPTPSPTTPTPTFFFALPTFTPTITQTLLPPTAGQGSGSGSVPTARPRKGGLTGQEWTCGINERTFPRVRPKERFTVFVTLRNTGTKPWGINTVDFVYTGGYRHEGTRIDDLPANVASGNTITLSVDFEAPKEPKTYNSFWTLKVGSYPFCGVKLSFQVTEK